jgi:hypothetical protein
MDVELLTSTAGAIVTKPQSMPATHDNRASIFTACLSFLNFFYRFESHPVKTRWVIAGLVKSP